MRRAGVLLGALLLAFGLTASPGWATITRTQGCSALNAGPTSNNANCTMGSAVAAGSIIIVGTTSYDITQTLTSITATGDSCATDVGPITNAASMRIYVGSCPNTAANTPTVTATWSAALTAGNYEMIAEVYTGARLTTPFDQTGNNTGNSGTCSATSAATTQANELVFGYCATQAAAAKTAGGGCVLRQETSSSGAGSEDKNVTSTGAQTCSFTFTSTQWAMIVATYIDATQGGTPQRSLTGVGL